MDGTTAHDGRSESEEEQEAEDVARLRAEFSLPENVLVHVWREEGKDFDRTRRRLLRQEEQSRSAGGDNDGWAYLAKIFVNAATSTLVSQPFFRVKVLQQEFGVGLPAALQLAVQDGWLNLWQGSEMNFLIRTASTLAKGLVFDFVLDVLTPEVGWPRVSQDDRGVLATLSFLISSLFSEAALSPLRVCATRSCATVSFDAHYFLKPWQESGVWGYFKGLGTLLMSKVVWYYSQLAPAEPRAAFDGAPAWITAFFDVLRNAGLYGMYPFVVHFLDTVFTLMAVHGRRYCCCFNLLLDTSDTTPLRGRRRAFMPFVGCLCGAVWRSLSELSLVA